MHQHSLRTTPLRATLGLLLVLASSVALAHGVAEGDQGYIEQTSGPQIGAFLYLGAKHMVTGYDHLLFLFGVIFFLYRMKHIATYVTLFAIGHSTTLLAGVLLGTNVSSYLVDAIIGLSVVYKALDNMGAYQRWLGVQPNTKAAVLIFGFFHGFGLATKLQEFSLSPDGLLINLPPTTSWSSGCGAPFPALIRFRGEQVTSLVWHRRRRRMV
jgi:hypothetical protein